MYMTSFRDEHTCTFLYQIQSLKFVTLNQKREETFFFYLSVPYQMVELIYKRITLY